MKETLEEFIEREGYPKGITQEIFADGVIRGAKWQAERMYNEEDLISFAHFYFKEEFNSSMQTSKSTKDIFTEWFEQFKKK
jgi:hypothetical protein